MWCLRVSRLYVRFRNPSQYRFYRSEVLPVEIGITNGISTEIISGVAEGTRVVTEATIGGMPGESMEAPTGQEGGERSPFMPGPPGSKKKK